MNDSRVTPSGESFVLLDAKLASGEVIVLDGATGFEILNFGGELNPITWCGSANLEHPDAVRKVHEAYIEAGADIITTNTFATCRHVLDGVGLGSRTVEVNQRAVELAKAALANQAPDRPVAIAGSMSTMRAWTPGSIAPDERYFPDKAQCEANFVEVAETLAGAGVDFLIMEMMLDLEYGPMATKAALSTGLPVWVGLSCMQTVDGKITGWEIVTEHPGEPPRKGFPPAPVFEELVDTFATMRPQVMGVMHSQIDATHPAVDILKSRWDGPIMAYPETLGMDDDGRREGFSTPPKAFADDCRRLTENGVQIIGGCCGTTVEHIVQMVKRVKH